MFPQHLTSTIWIPAESTVPEQQSLKPGESCYLEIHPHITLITPGLQQLPREILTVIGE